MGNMASGMWRGMPDEEKDAMGQDADAKEAARNDDYKKRHVCLWKTL